MRLNNLIQNQQIMFLVSVMLVGFFALWVVGDLSAPILTSIVLAFLFRPMHVYFTKIGIPERLSVFITFLIAEMSVASFCRKICFKVCMRKSSNACGKRSLLKSQNMNLLMIFLHK